MNADLSGQLRTPAAIEAYITGGNAYATIRSKKSGTRYTYRFQAAPNPNLTRDTRPIFVSVLNGDDNESDYRFFGTIFISAETKQILEYKHSRKTRITEEAPCVKAIRWVLGNIRRGGTALENPSNFLHQVEVWHEGRCGRCGRKLTVPESVSSGFGPECIQHVRP